MLIFQSGWLGFTRGIASNLRAPSHPEIPTAAEQGFPKYLVESWFAAVAPAKMSADNVRRIHGAVATAFTTEDVKVAMARQGNTINIQSPEASAVFFQSELNKYAAIVKKAGIKPD
jgi:tripartite-type tricarboxylate transporter receptor subunit TctC